MRATVLPYPERYVASRLQHAGATAEEIVTLELGMIGDAGQCAERIERLRQAGVRHLLLILSFGAMPEALVEESRTRFAADVMPSIGGLALARAPQGY